MTEVWLVRHGQTEWSRSGQHTSTTDLPLLPEGEEQARGLRDLLAQQEFSLVLSSPLLRARTTAHLAGFDPELCDDLIEWRYGPGEGLTSAQIRELVPNWRVWTHGAPVIEGKEPGESSAQVIERLSRVVRRIRDADVERVLLFGHGHALRALATVWCDLNIEAGAHFPLATGAYSVLGYEKTTPALVRWNAQR